MKNADYLVNEMKRKLREKINNNSLDLRSLDDITYDCVEDFKKLVQEEANNTLNEEKEIGKECPKCGKINKPKKYNSKKIIKTRTGDITVNYNIYKCLCGECYHSIEEKYHGIIVDEQEIKVSPQVAEMITEVGVTSRSFNDAERILKDFNLVSITSPQIRKITEYIGLKIHDDIKEKSENTYDNIVELADKEVEIKKGYTMVIEFDGSMIRKLLETGTEWKELKLGVILVKNAKAKVIRRGYISYFGEAEVFKKFLFQLAVDMNYLEMENIQVIADGAHWIWNICKELFPNAIEVLDYYHCKENVYGYYKIVYPNDDKKANKEAKKIMNMIEQEKNINKVLKKIPSVENIPLGVVNLPSYLEYHKNRIKYKTLLEKGFDIGSGVIESGNKNVIQHRMKQTGMQWHEDSIKAISTLRCKLFSEKWNDVIEKIQKYFTPVLSVAA